MPEHQKRYDHLVEGFVLPERVIGPVRLFDFVRYQGASGDYNPHHYDREVLEAAGYSKFFSPGMLQAGYLAAHLGDSLGPDTIRRFGVRFGEMLYVGETVTCSGVVSRRYAGRDSDCVDVDLTCRTDDGREVVTGSATTMIPSAREHSA